MVSAALNKLNELQITRFAYSKLLIVGLNCIVLTIVFAYINSWLFSKGFASQNLLFMGEKVLLFFKGNPPRIDNLIFVYPPIPYLFVLLIRNPFLSSALVGGMTVSLLLWYLWKHLYIIKKMPKIFYICLMYICVSPLSLYLFSEQITSCLLNFSILLCLHLFYLYYKSLLPINLFLFGILSATVFFIHFEVSFIIAIWALPGIIIVSKKSKENLITLLTATYFPLIFFSVSWCYFNWLYMDDPFHFSQRWQVTLFNTKSETNLISNSTQFFDYFNSSLETFANNYFFVIPSAFLILMIAVVKKFRDFVLLQILMFPFFIVCVDIFWGGLFNKSGNHFFLIFIGTGIYVFINHERLSLCPVVKKLYTTFLFLSFCFSLWAPLYSGTIEEKLFTRALYGNSDFKNIDIEKRLLSEIQDGGKILLDDSVLYSLVYLSNDPQRFILPHESEFGTVLAKPELFVKYIIAHNNSEKDLISSHYNLDSKHDIRNFNLIGQFDYLSLYTILIDKPL
jgi:hypothetical protein